MEKLEDLKDILPNKLYADVEDLLDIYANIKYDYLDLSFGVWEDLVVRTSIKILEKEMVKDKEACFKNFGGELAKYVNLSVRNYIINELKNGRIRICNNLLIKLRRTLRGGRILRNFVYEFEFLGISFIDNVFFLMKEKSLTFQKILDSLGILYFSKDEMIDFLNKEYQFDFEKSEDKKVVKDKSIDYSSLDRKYSNLSFEEIKDLYGDEFDNLSNKSKDLLKRYFNATSNSFDVYQAEKELTLLMQGFKRNNTNIDINKLKEAYLNNKELFSEEQRLYLECYIFNMRSKDEFQRKYPNSLVNRRKAHLINKLERLYFGIDKLFLYTLTKEQYLKVLELYPMEVSGFRKELLDLYYGVNGSAKSIMEISKIYKLTVEKTNELIWAARKYFLSLYNNINTSIKIDKNTYLPYVLDKRYEMHSEMREALTLLLNDNLSYDEIAKKFNQKKSDKLNKPKTSRDIATLVSKGLQKIDTYRFGIDKPIIFTKNNLNKFFNNENTDEMVIKVIRLKYLDFLDNDNIAELLNINKDKVNRIVSDFNSSFKDSEIKNVTLTTEEIEIEINRHSTDSVITENEKNIVSYYLGIKSNINLNGEKLTGEELNKRFNVKGDIARKVRDILDKIKRRKIGRLTPDLIYIDRETLSKILEDSHLPISMDDREIICYLLGLNGYPVKTCKELANIFPINDKAIKRKYQMAIISINKYLLGEKEGIINYELDIVPNLKYFTLSERMLIKDYYNGNLSYDDLAKKYGLAEGKVKSMMYRIKVQINRLVKESSENKFDFDYYKHAVQASNLPFYGNKDLAKTIFELYVGYNSFDKLTIEEIKKVLKLDLSEETILNIINNFILSIYKYRLGITKENTFSIEEVKSYYLENKNNLTPQELKLFATFFNKNVGIDYKMDDDLVYLLLKGYNYDCFSLANMSKEKIGKILKKYSKQLSKKAIDALRKKAGLSERDFMSGQDKNKVYRLLNNLDKKLARGNVQKRVLSCAC